MSSTVQSALSRARWQAARHPNCYSSEGLEDGDRRGGFTRVHVFRAPHHLSESGRLRVWIRFPGPSSLAGTGRGEVVSRRGSSSSCRAAAPGMLPSAAMSTERRLTRYHAHSSHNHHMSPHMRSNLPSLNLRHLRINGLLWFSPTVAGRSATGGPPPPLTPGMLHCGVFHLQFGEIRSEAVGGGDGQPRPMVAGECRHLWRSGSSPWRRGLTGVLLASATATPP